MSIYQANGYWFQIALAGHPATTLDCITGKATTETFIGDSPQGK
jgi:hypothetical protein